MFTTCAKCGQKKQAHKAAYEKRLAQFGGNAERMAKEWMCRGCKKQFEEEQKKASQA